MAARGSCGGRAIGSPECWAHALSAAALVEVTKGLGVGCSPGNLSSWRLLTHPKVREGEMIVLTLKRGRREAVRESAFSWALHCWSKRAIRLACGGGFLNARRCRPALHNMTGAKCGRDVWAGQEFAVGHAMGSADGVPLGLGV